MEQIIKETTEKLSKGIITQDEANKILLDLFDVSNSTVNERPSPYKWLKEEKWKIPQGATYYDPKVTLTQCAGWIMEYIKKYCC